MPNWLRLVLLSIPDQLRCLVANVLLLSAKHIDHYAVVWSDRRVAAKVFSRFSLHFFMNEGL